MDVAMSIGHCCQPYTRNVPLLIMQSVFFLKTVAQISHFNRKKNESVPILTLLPFLRLVRGAPDQPPFRPPLVVVRHRRVRSSLLLVLLVLGPVAQHQRRGHGTASGRKARRKASDGMYAR
jgi:hypothetical protein